MNSSNVLLSKLRETFSLVKDWLKYAEAKSAVLLAFSGAGISSSLSFMTSISSAGFSSLVVNMLAVSTFGMCLSAVFSALSFIPKTDPKQLRSNTQRHVTRQLNGSRAREENLFFFGHIKHHTSESFIDAINSKYILENIEKPYPREATDIADQIIINSILTSNKLKLFSYGIYTLLVSICVIPLFILVSLLIENRI